MVSLRRGAPLVNNGSSGKAASANCDEVCVEPWRAPDALPIDPRELSRAVDCPGCGRRMETHPYYGPGLVVVDTCAACTLIWLDHGELGVIERAPGRT